MEVEFQSLSLKSPLEYGLYGILLDLDYFMQNVLRLVLWGGSSFLLDPILNTSPKPAPRWP